MQVFVESWTSQPFKKPSTQEVDVRGRSVKFIFEQKGLNQFYFNLDKGNNN